MNILSIQSHVVFGRVGNKAAVFPLERMGFEVWPLNTVQFSNHPGYEGWRGRAFAPDHLDELWEGLERTGVASSCDAIISGYVGNPDTASSIAAIVRKAGALNPHLVYLCDPVIGDTERGVYVKPGLLEFYREEALPLATIIKPNKFEAELLSGMKLDTKNGLRKACDFLHSRGPRQILITSVDAPVDSQGRPGIRTILSLGDRGFAIDTDLLPFAMPPHGAGDLVSALYMGNYLKYDDPAACLERSIHAVFAVLEATSRSGLRELQIISTQEAFAETTKKFPVVRIW